MNEVTLKTRMVALVIAAFLAVAGASGWSAVAVYDAPTIQGAINAGSAQT